MAVKIGVVSQGCPKNLVDTEVMIGILRDQGYEFVQDMAKADVVLINTCCFISDAREEAFMAILEAGQQKRYGTVKGIVVTGCLPQRYRESLRQMAPEVDVFLGTAGYKDIAQAVQGALENKRYEQFSSLDLTENFEQRVIQTPKPTAYIKIAEGCDNHCTYCVIPSVRGPFVSRRMEDIVEEASRLASDGYSEVILVAQDTTRYGEDLYGEPRLAELLEQLSGIDGIKWLRVLYMYPDRITDRLLEVMCAHDNIVNYIDMPIQHLNDNVLKKMNRLSTSKDIFDALEKIRKADPDFIVRSSVIAGFPGETSEEHFELVDKLGEANFNRLGVFAYSQEEGTPAAKMPDQIDDYEKNERRDTIYNHQSTISYKHNVRRVGEECEVLVEGYDARSKLYYGRSYAEAPEIDGMILIKTTRKLEPGKFYKVRIARAFNYDCLAELLPEKELDA